MANTKISQLTATTTPTGNEELVYALNNANGKMTLDTMKSYSNVWQQATLVSWVNIKTINGLSVLWSWNITIEWGGWQPSYDYSAMQWPCATWYHIPMESERANIKTIWTTLGWTANDWAGFWAAVKMPFAWDRAYASGNINNQWTSWKYWSVTADGTLVSSVMIGSWTFSTTNGQQRSRWFTIRAIKDEPVVPDAWWTMTYWVSIQDGWIFWSSADWLVSLSSDWETWITIADKNLWATTVWSSWDTESYANCWNYYQRWNNYWFDWWTVTTSSTQVDASTYWPWNYYTWSTFIKWSSDWSSVQNDNLWWWVTWPQQQWWWWAGWYDCIVASDWTWDYITIWAAVNAGNHNIFVKNWSYTEATWRDPYTNNSSLLHIVWESESWVQITMPDTMTTANWYMIDMRYNNAADFYMENLSFNITLTSTNKIFYIDSWWSNFLVKNCSFTYTTTNTGASETYHFLFYTNVISDSLPETEPWRILAWLIWCYFNTETTEIINIWRHVTVAYLCKFYSNAWRIQFVQQNYKAKLYNCYVDSLYLWWLYEFELYNSSVTVWNWDMYSSSWHEIGLYRVDNSYFKLGTLANTPTIWIWVCTNSVLNFWNYDVSTRHSFGSLNSIASNCKIYCWAYRVSDTTWCYIEATSLAFNSTCLVTWCVFSNKLTSVTINNTHNIINWNVFKWTWTMTLTWTELVFTSNVLKSMTLSDTWTDNVKANNITA